MLRTVAVVLTLLCGVAAYAQPNTVLDHYRAYLAALERGDYAGADREGAAALAASEARDGDGGTTAVLALNLAELRLDAGNGAAALAPATRAATIAQARSDSRVDPLAARLVLGRAELAAGTPGAQTRLRAALDEALARTGYDDRGFLAARDLAIAIRPSSAQAGLEAWEFAGRFTQNNPSWRAEAYIGQGEALIELTNLTRYRTTDTRMTPRSDTRAYAAFTEASNLLQRYLQQSDHTPGVIMPAQAYYARTLAYLAVLRALQVTVERESERTRGWLIDRTPGDGLPPCQYDLTIQPRPSYPREALARWGVGGVTVRVMTDEAGAVIEAAALASVGGASFSEAVNAVAPRWPVELEPGMTNCSRSVVMYMPVMFVLR